MPKKSGTVGEGAKVRRDKAEETTRSAKAFIDAEREAAKAKTSRLREARLAKEADEAAEAAAAAAKPATKKRRATSSG